MDIIIKILQFFLCFTLLVGIHEFGHFIVARMFKIRVEKFYIFFDPWFSLFKFKRGETEYGLGWLPLGGYCKIGGMIDESMDTEQMNKEARPDDFRSKPAWQRLLVMLAGVFMNIVIAITIYSGISWVYGKDYIANEDVKWGYNFNNEGHRLGFRDGDRILNIDGKPIDNFMSIYNDLLITADDRKVEIVRNGKTETLNLKLDSLIAMRQRVTDKAYKNQLEIFMLPRRPFIVEQAVLPTAQALQKGDQVIAINDQKIGDHIEGIKFLRTIPSTEAHLKVVRQADTLALDIPVSAEGTLGVSIAESIKHQTQEFTFLESIPAGFSMTAQITKDYCNQLKLIVQPESKLYKEVGGFIAIGNIFPSQWNWLDFWIKTALLSIILAVMNLLPIPGLDGGHAMFTLWEVITGRKVNERVLEIAQYIGMFLLLFLLLYANGNDIYKFLIK